MFHLVPTGRFPESYEVRLYGRAVGAVRVARRRLVAECRGAPVLAVNCDGHSRLTDDERPGLLAEACCAVLAALAADGTAWWLYTVAPVSLPAGGPGSPGTAG